MNGRLWIDRLMTRCRIFGYEARIAALERKVGQLTMDLDPVKKTPRLRLVNDGGNSSIASGPMPVPSDWGSP
jgi:hypothetical protein